MRACTRIPVVYLTVLVVSSAGLVFELLFGTVASYLLGDSITEFATLTGLFLSAMGVGAWLTRHVETEVARRVVECQLAAALVGGATAPLLFLAFARASMFRAILFGLVALTGILVGALVLLLLPAPPPEDDAARAYGEGAHGRLRRGARRVARVRPRPPAAPRDGAGGPPDWIDRRGERALGDVGAGRGGGRGPRSGSARAPRSCSRGLGATRCALRAGACPGSRTRAVFSDPVIYTKQSAYQRIVLTRGHGGINLFLDNNLQSSAADEYRYHEALVHPALAAAPRHADVLVLGGGDGLAAREILRYPDVASVTLAVDLDERHDRPRRGVPGGCAS